MTPMAEALFEGPNSESVRLGYDRKRAEALGIEIAGQLVKAADPTTAIMAARHADMLLSIDLRNSLRP